MTQVVSYEYFLNHVEKEVADMHRATTYRQTTAEMALKALKSVQRAELFATREMSYKALQALLSGTDEERLLDVSKYLNVLYRQLETWSTLPAHVVAKLQEKAQKRNKLSFDM